MLKFRKLAAVWPDACEYLVKPPRGIQLTWWPHFCDRVGGLRVNELTLLCAPTGAGKTQLLASIAAQLLMQGIPTYVAPVETGDTDFVIRVTECLAQQSLNNGDPQGVERISRIDERFGEMVNKGPLWVSTHDNRVAIEEMIQTLRFMNQTHGVQVALLDNLNFFLNVTSMQMERAEMDNAIHEFVMLAKQVPVHVILVVHPKKTDNGRVESEFDIKGSSVAVQEASNVVLFNRPKQADVEKGLREHTDRELVFRKIRKRGINVGKPVWFSYERGRYEEYE